MVLKSNIRFPFSVLAFDKICAYRDDELWISGFFLPASENRGKHILDLLAEDAELQEQQQQQEIALCVCLHKAYNFYNVLQYKNHKFS
jgi:hypothetical protein